MSENYDHDLAGTIFEEALANLERDHERRFKSIGHFLALGRGCDAAMCGSAKYQPGLNIPCPPGTTDEARAKHDEKLYQAAFETWRLGCDFKIILDAIKDDPFLMSEWERFTLSLKMREVPK